MPYDNDSELQLAEVHERLEVSIKTELTTIVQQCYLVILNTNLKRCIGYPLRCNNYRGSATASRVTVTCYIISSSLCSVR